MNCKYCGTKITLDNMYSLNICNNKKCLWQHLKVCCEDCFNCPYHDCIVSEHRLVEGNYNLNKITEEKAGWEEHTITVVKTAGIYGILKKFIKNVPSADQQI